MSGAKPAKLLSSGYSQGLVIHKFDADSGRMEETARADAKTNLSFFALDRKGRNLYAVREDKDGAVSRWKMNEDGGFEEKEEFPSGGAEPAHVALDAERRLLFVTNYGGGSLTVFRLAEDGSIVEKPVYQEGFKQGSGVDPERQEASHLHGTFLLGDFAYVVDLGADRIYCYKVQDGGASVAKAERFETAVEAGAGPRHMAFDADKKRAFLVNELKNKLMSFSVDDQTGELKLLHSVDYNVPCGDKETETRQYGAAIAVHPNGRFVFVSNRGDGAVLSFRVDDCGHPEQQQAVATTGTWPRHFALSEDGRHLVVADQKKHTLESFKVDPQSGQMEKGHEVQTGQKPAMVLFM